jgi:hypothetical protein
VGVLLSTFFPFDLQFLDFSGSTIRVLFQICRQSPFAVQADRAEPLVELLLVRKTPKGVPTCVAPYT